MTTTDQIITAAESVGITNIRLVKWSDIVGSEPKNGEPECFMGDIIYGYGGETRSTVVHNYHSDLNAMHELEMTLHTEPEQHEYNKQLYNSCFKNSDEVTPDMLSDAELTFIINTASAPTRLEAYLRTKGLWKTT